MNASQGLESMENPSLNLDDCLEVETRSRALQTKYEEVAWFLWLGVGHETSFKCG